MPEHVSHQNSNQNFQTPKFAKNSQFSQLSGISGKFRICGSNGFKTLDMVQSFLEHWKKGNPLCI